MGFGSFFHKLAPWLAAGAQFIPGAGPVVAATITKIASDHGVTLPGEVQPTVDSIGDAVAALSGNSAALLALKQADQTYAEQMQAAGFKQVTDLEALANEDRANARDLEAKTGDKTAQKGFYIITVGFFGTLVFVILHPIPGTARDLVNVMIGSLGTAWIQAVAYYYGSSRGSDDKTKVLADIAKQP